MNRARLSLAIMSFLIFLLTPSSSWAQKGDRQGEVQKENWRQWSIPEAPVYRRVRLSKLLKLRLASE